MKVDRGFGKSNLQMITMFDELLKDKKKADKDREKILDFLKKADCKFKPILIPFHYPQDDLKK